MSGARASAGWKRSGTRRLTTCKVAQAEFEFDAGQQGLVQRDVQVVSKEGGETSLHAHFGQDAV